MWHIVEPAGHGFKKGRVAHAVGTDLADNAALHLGTLGLALLALDPPTAIEEAADMDDAASAVTSRTGREKSRPSRL